MRNNQFKIIPWLERARFQIETRQMSQAMKRQRAWERGGDTKVQRTLPLCKTNLENSLLITRPSRRRDQEGEPGLGEQRSKSVQNQRPAHPLGAEARIQGRLRARPWEARPAFARHSADHRPRQVRTRATSTLVHTHARPATCSHPWPGALQLVS